ncbi:MAG: hypothetical protein H5T44_01290 [Thermoplasmatales archaeon]|nr:hypothetical protein [Thermoplasmatales archaeon]
MIGIVILYKLKTPMSKAEVKKAKEEWEKFKKSIKKDVKLIGEYAHAWGTSYNGFMLMEAKSFDAFQKFWGEFRDVTRWYAIETHTIFGEKE